MGKLVLPTGSIYGQLKVLSQTANIVDTVCGCGRRRLVKTTQLKHGHIKACAVCAHEKVSNKGGQTARKEYNSWRHLNKRCLDPSDSQYPRYGGRGIKVCERWHRDNPEGFANFLKDMGNKPTAGYSIDRIDNDGDYTTSNCRWTDPGTQASNKATNILLTLNGKTQTIKQWSIELGIKAGTLQYRYHRGQTVEQILTKPVESQPKDVSITVDGVTKLLVHWAAESGVPVGTIRNRIKRGIDPKAAVFSPPDKVRRFDGQVRNRDRKNNVLLTVNGVTKTLAEWARESPVSETGIAHRISLGWTHEAAVLSPRIGRGGPPPKAASG